MTLDVELLEARRRTDRMVASLPWPTRWIWRVRIAWRRWHV